MQPKREPPMAEARDESDAVFATAAELFSLLSTPMRHVSPT